MKKIFPALAVLCCCVIAASAGPDAADDCPGAADACKALPKTVSPFMVEVKKAEKALKITQEKPRQTELKSAPAAVSSATAAGAVRAAEPEKKTALSKPAWLLAVFASLAGLYYFLKEKNSGAKNRDA